MPSDEQKRQIITNQKATLQRAEVTYEVGLELRTMTGWFGYRSIGGSPSLFGMPSAGGEVAGVMIQEIDVAMPDQEVIEMPLRRIVFVRYAPMID